MSYKKKKKLFLEKINSPEDLKGLNIEDLIILSYLSINSLGLIEAFFEAKDMATPCSSLPHINATSFLVSLLYLAYMSAGI